MVCLIHALKAGDFEQVMGILARGPDAGIDIGALEIEVNRVNFTEEQLDVFWPELKRVYPRVAEFWEYFDMASEGLPLPPILNDNQRDALYLGAVYYKQEDIKKEIESNYIFERTPRFLEWLEQCKYQASFVE